MLFIVILDSSLLGATWNSDLERRTSGKIRDNWLNYSDELYSTIYNTVDHFYGYNTCTANIPSNNHIFITHEVITEYLYYQELLPHITCIQISLCHKYLSICFKDRDTMETFCKEEHFIISEPFIFTPDYQKKKRISIENVTTELHDTKMRTF